MGTAPTHIHAQSRNQVFAIATMNSNIFHICVAAEVPSEKGC